MYFKEEISKCKNYSMTTELFLEAYFISKFSNFNIYVNYLLRYNIYGEVNYKIID